MADHLPALDVPRYSRGYGDMEPDRFGQWVRYDDYERACKGRGSSLGPIADGPAALTSNERCCRYCGLALKPTEQHWRGEGTVSHLDTQTCMNAQRAEIERLKGLLADALCAEDNTQKQFDEYRRQSETSEKPSGNSQASVSNTGGETPPHCGPSNALRLLSELDKYLSRNTGNLIHPRSCFHDSIRAVLSDAADSPVKSEGEPK